VKGTYEQFIYTSESSSRLLKVMRYKKSNGSSNTFKDTANFSPMKYSESINSGTINMIKNFVGK
jgi:hypothetical protein